MLILKMGVIALLILLVQMFTIAFSQEDSDVKVSESETVKGGLINCTVKGEKCPINRICEYRCQYSCIDTSLTARPVYGTTIYSANSSICKAAVHDLHSSIWDGQSRYVKIKSYKKDGCFLEGSVRFGIASYYLQMESCNAFEFVNPTVAEIIYDVVSIHSNYLYGENENHIQHCFAGLNAIKQSFQFYTRSNWLKSDDSERSVISHDGYVQYTKVWKDSFDVGFQCVPSSSTLSVITSIAFRKNAGFLPEYITVRANRNENVFLNMIQEGAEKPENSTVWTKDGRTLQLTTKDERKLLLENVNQSSSGIYSLGYENSLDAEKLGWMQLIVRRCPKEKYGFNCSLTCPFCLNGGICHDITGECLCAPGFNGSSCEKVCPPGYLGKMCSIKCPIQDNTASQYCKGVLVCLPEPYGCSCASGFTGINCNITCDNGSYGADCLQRHLHLHPKLESCSKFSDTCECLDGWHGPLCNLSFPVLGHAPTLLNVSKDSLDFSFRDWSKDSDLGIGKPMYYEIVYKESGNITWERYLNIEATNMDNRTTRKVSVTGLKPGTNFQVAVIVIDETGNKQEDGIEVLNVTTLCDAPMLSPSDIRPIVFEQNITILWTVPPKETWNCWDIDTTIKLRDDSSNTVSVVKTNETSYSFDSEPYVTWSVEVCISAVNSSPNDTVCSEPENVTGVSMHPQMPTQLKVVKYETSLFFFWLPPLKYSGKIKSYMINYEDKTDSVVHSLVLEITEVVCESEGMSYHCCTLKDLHPGHSYTIEISALMVKEDIITIETFTVKLEDAPVSYAVICSILLPLIVAIILLAYLCKRKKVMSSLKVKFFPYKVENEFAACNEALDEMDIIETESLCEEASNRIFVDDLPEYVKQNIQNNKIKKEFLSLPNGQIYPCSFAKYGENKPKNRYGNILPYDHSRVILDTIKGDPFSSYIHASYIHGYGKAKKYIATQGPLLETVNDFWRMVWNEGSCKILMISNFVENGKPKCEKYWPESSTSYGDIAVSYQASKSYADFIVRTFKVSKGKNSRDVKQFHYVSWPDHGSPPSTATFVMFMKQVRLDQPQNTTPVIVHCSAGIGRTGATILLDIMIDMGTEEKCVDLVNHLFNMRKQRMNILENIDQYIFVHCALIECLCFETSLVKVPEFKLVYERLQKVDEATGISFLEQKFQAMNRLSIELMYKDTQAAYMLENQSKNRFMHILPPDRARPYLSGDTCSTGYINAVYVDSYSTKNAFIATQYPLDKTAEDFWSMIYEVKSKTIVFLQGIEFPETESPQLWSKEGVKTFGPFQIQCQSITDEEFLVANIILSDNNKDVDNSFPIDVYVFQDWPCTSNLPTQPNSFAAMISKILSSKSEPHHVITTVCLNGLTACGIFCSILYICDQIQTDEIIDVVQAVKCVRGNRPQFISNLEQYKFVYDQVLLHLETK